MAQFTFRWKNDNVVADQLATGQIAGYRVKSIGGTFITSGFNPSNPLSIVATTADTPNNLPDNKVIEFKVQCDCSASGISDNDNGIQESINFACITPTLSHTSTSATIVLDLSATDITKARLTLRKASDNTTVNTTTAARGGTGVITYVVSTGITSLTNYYWQIELYANVNNIEVISSNSDQTGSVCSPYPFTTDAPPVCNPATAGTISSIEVL